MVTSQVVETGIRFALHSNIQNGKEMTLLRDLGNTELWKAAVLRAVRTLFQAMAGMVTVDVAINEIDWIHIILVSLTASLLSMLTSIIAGLPESKEDGIITFDPDTQQCRLEITNRKKFANNEPMRFTIDPMAFTELDVTKHSKKE